MTREEAAQRAGISMRTLRRAERENRIVFDKGQHGRWVITEQALREAPILRPGKALAACDIHPERYRSYLYRSQRRRGLKPSAGDRSQRYISAVEAENISQEIKQSESAQDVLREWRRTDAKKKLERFKDPFLAQKNMADRHLDYHLLSLTKSSSKTLLNHRLKRIAADLERRKQESNMGDREITMLMYASGLVKLKPEDQLWARQELKRRLMETVKANRG
jgi:hypothetical protein